MRGLHKGKENFPFKPLNDDDDDDMARKKRGLAKNIERKFIRQFGVKGSGRKMILYL